MKEPRTADGDDEAVRVIMDVQRKVPGAGRKSQEQECIITLAAKQLFAGQDGAADVITLLEGAVPFEPG
jgi:hypothetical protein